MAVKTIRPPHPFKADYTISWDNSGVLEDSGGGPMTVYIDGLDDEVRPGQEDYDRACPLCGADEWTAFEEPHHEWDAVDGWHWDDDRTPLVAVPDKVLQMSREDTRALFDVCFNCGAAFS